MTGTETDQADVRPTTSARLPDGEFCPLRCHNRRRTGASDLSIDSGSKAIPAATANEPGLDLFSSDAAKQHVDLAATLWAKQKKCVSCHTHGIYMLVRPALTRFWGEPDETTRSFVVEQMRELMAGGDRYGSVPVQMAYIARGLAAWDSQLKQNTSPETDTALRFVFEMQADDGSIRAKDRFPPINSTTWFGSTMTAMAVADAPGWLPSLKDAELLTRIARLKAFLQETPPRNDHEGLMLLWASTFIPDLLGTEREDALKAMVWRHQRDDGGWSIRTFAAPDTLAGGRRAESLKTDPTFLNPASDGYQTGLAVVVLRDAGIPADDSRLRQAVNWLLANQRESGRWWTRSLNTASRFHFISYSGTVYSSLALAKCGVLPDVSESIGR